MTAEGGAGPPAVTGEWRQTMESGAADGSGVDPCLTFGTCACRICTSVHAAASSRGSSTSTRSTSTIPSPVLVALLDALGTLIDANESSTLPTLVLVGDVLEFALMSATRGGDGLRRVRRPGLRARPPSLRADRLLRPGQPRPSPLGAAPRAAGGPADRRDPARGAARAPSPTPRRSPATTTTPPPTSCSRCSSSAGPAART